MITNNSERLSNHLYTHFKQPATEILVEEVLTLVNDSSKESRLNLIIYCLEQVSLQLNPKHKTMFIRMINEHITRKIHAYQDNKEDKNRKVL